MNRRKPTMRPPKTSTKVKRLLMEAKMKTLNIEELERSNLPMKTYYLILRKYQS